MYNVHVPGACIYVLVTLAFFFLIRAEIHVIFNSKTKILNSETWSNLLNTKTKLAFHITDVVRVLYFSTIGIDEQKVECIHQLLNIAFFFWMLQTYQKKKLLQSFTTTCCSIIHKFRTLNKFFTERDEKKGYDIVVE